MWHFILHNELSKSFDKCAFAHAGFSNQDGVILFTTGEDLRHAFNLIMTTNDRIQCSVGGRFCQVHTITVQDWRIFVCGIICDKIRPAAASLARFSTGRNSFFVVGRVGSQRRSACAQLTVSGNELHRVVVVQVERSEHFAPFVGFISQHRQEQMYVRGVILSLQTCFELCQSQNAVNITCHLGTFGGNTPFIDRGFDLCFQRIAQLICGNAKLFDHFQGRAFAIVEHTKQKRDSTHLVLVRATCLCLAERKDTGDLWR